MARRGLNKVMLIGNLGAEPEVRYLPSGSAVANVRLATNESWRDKDTGEQQDRTEWHRVVFFGRLAEVIKEYVHKGSQIYVEGRIQTQKWQDRDGNDRYTTEIVANEMQMLGGRDGDSSSSAPYDQGAPTRSAPAAAQPPAERPPATGVDSSPANDFDDDIPF